jgi:pimeloyl-ACP methyl ester carboxylesterase
MSPSSDRYRRELTLPDGRTLSYADVGDPAGRPIVLMHGTPSSRLDALWLDDAARRAGWRLLAPDRPGHGWSSPQPGRRVLDWPADVLALVDDVVGRGATAPPVALLGFSGGAPYALATAHLAPERVSMVAVVSGWGPPDRPGAYDGVARSQQMFDAVTRRAPVFTRAVLGATGLALRRLPALAAALLRGRVQLGPLAESLRQGGSGATQDLRLIVRPWGFALGAVSVPVLIWHGDRDPEIPLHHAEFLVRIVHDATLEVLPGGDHLALFSHADQIFETLAERSRTSVKRDS